MVLSSSKCHTIAGPKGKNNEVNSYRRIQPYTTADHKGNRQTFTKQRQNKTLKRVRTGVVAAALVRPVGDRAHWGD